MVRSGLISSTLRDSINSMHQGDTANGGLAIKNASLYPNPFSDAFTAEFTLSADAAVRIDLYNTAGQRVYSKDKTQLKAGKYRILISPGRLEAGMYVLKLTQNDSYSINLKAIRR